MFAYIYMKDGNVLEKHEDPKDITADGFLSDGISYTGYDNPESIIAFIITDEVLELGKPLPTGTKDLRQDAPGTSPEVRIKQLEDALKASREENATTQAAVVALFEMIMPSAPDEIPGPEGTEGTSEEVI